jgi:hypothetical protein
VIEKIRNVFAFLVIFNKLPQKLGETLLARFMREHGDGPRHRILYMACRLCPSRALRERRYSGYGDLIIANPPYFRDRAKRQSGE